MADPLNDGWPLYPTGSPKHMQALGVVSVNYNLFEQGLFGFFGLLVERIGVPDFEAGSFYGQLSNARRVEFLQLYFDKGGKDANVRDAGLHLIKYWNRCFENRNLLMHSQFRHASFLSEIGQDSGNYPVDVPRRKWHPIRPTSRCSPRAVRSK